MKWSNYISTSFQDNTSIKPGRKKKKIKLAKMIYAKFYLEIAPLTFEYLIILGFVQP